MDAPVEAAEQRASVSNAFRPRGDLLARVIGLLIALLGVGIICGVLWLAFALYRDPTLGHIPPGDPKQGPSATEVGSTFINLVFRIALLALMSVSGSLVANKGIHMFLSSFPSRD